MSNEDWFALAVTFLAALIFAKGISAMRRRLSREKDAKASSEPRPQYVRVKRVGPEPRDRTAVDAEILPIDPVPKGKDRSKT